MTHKIFGSLLLMAALTVPSKLAAQGPDGSDINKAIPIYFGQVVNDIGDRATAYIRVYSITLARGQRISVTMTTSVNATFEAGLYTPDKRTVNACGYGCRKDGVVAGQDTSNGRSVSFDYQVAAAGTYYLYASFGGTGISYSLQVLAQGTPIAVPNPSTAGCIRGAVDYITYSLQLIAVGLADELSIGGTKVCGSCTVKAPLYPEIVNRIENALRSKVNAEACYDATGNIFQIKLLQP